LGDAFAEVYRTLRDDGTLWVIIGDSYVSNLSTSTVTRAQQGNGSGRFHIPDQHHVNARRGKPNRATALIRAGLPMKNMIGIPGRLATELQSRGWILRADIIWQKPTSLPENVRDRPTSVYEHVLLFVKSDRYFYNAAVTAGSAGGNGRNLWTFPVNRFRGDHHAMMPAALAERCIQIGSPVGATVLDPFARLGTVGLAAIQHGRNSVLVELDPDHAARIRQRLG
jgi:DNA modification methylase